MNFNLSSRCRFKNFNYESAKVGDYFIEAGYSEPYIIQLIEITNDMVRLKPILQIRMDGSVTEDGLPPLYLLLKDNAYICILKALPKKYVHEINKLIIFSS